METDHATFVRTATTTTTVVSSAVSLTSDSPDGHSAVAFSELDHIWISVLCLVALPVCFLCFGVALLILVHRHLQHAMEQMMANTEALRTRPSGTVMPSLEDDVPQSLQSCDCSSQSIAVQIGSLTNSHICQPTSSIHLNSPVTSYSSSRSSRTTGSSLIIANHLQQCLNQQNAISLEWDYFLPNSNYCYESYDYLMDRIPLLNNREYWV